MHQKLKVVHFAADLGEIDMPFGDMNRQSLVNIMLSNFTLYFVSQ